MAEVINLNRFRKSRKRDAQRAAADANRLAHGRTLAEKRADREQQSRRDALLDGAKRED
ncbi:DUF4169 family protein [Sphingomonas sp.]